MHSMQTPVSCRTDEQERQTLKEAISTIRTSYAGRPDDLIPMLQSVQKTLGYLPEDALQEIAHITRVPAASVFGVATFYSQFRLQPAGKHIIKICTGTACHVRGSHRILQNLEKRLQVKPGQTTGDRQFTLQTVACFGACALAPVVVVDESVNGRMNASTVSAIVEDLGNEKLPGKTDPEESPEESP